MGVAQPDIIKGLIIWELSMLLGNRLMVTISLTYSTDYYICLRYFGFFDYFDDFSGVMDSEYNTYIAIFE